MTATATKAAKASERTPLLPSRTERRGSRGSRAGSNARSPSASASASASTSSAASPTSLTSPISETTTAYSYSYSDSRTASSGTIGSSASNDTATHPRKPAATPLHVRPAPLMESMSTARFVLILAGIWSSNFAFAFQSTAIPTLAPTISSTFSHAELGSFLGSAFTLGNTAGIPMYGVLIETLGRKFAMLTACAFFGFGTVACALSTGMETLVAARAVTGLGGGGLLTVSAVICTDLVPLRERGYYQGIMMTIFGLGSTIGGPLSGYLTDRYSWPLSFWVQVPIVIWCAVIVGTFLPEPPTPPTHESVWRGLASLDWGGILLLLGSVTGFILGLSFHTSFFLPWSDARVWGVLLASVGGIIAFILVETRVKRPIVPVQMFQSSQLVAIWLSGTFLSIASQAFLFHVPMYFAVLVDSSAAQAGLVVSICSGIGLSIGSLVAGYYIRSGGRYTLLGVFALIPSIVSSFVAAQWTPKWPMWSYYATVLPTNVGYAIFLNVTLIALISSVDVQTMPKGTALLYTVRSLGSTLGVSLGGSIQVGALVASLHKKFKHTPNAAEIIDAVVHSKAAIKTLPPHQQKLALAAYAISLSTVWRATGAVAVCTLLCALWIKQNDVHLVKRGEDESE